MNFVLESFENSCHEFCMSDAVNNISDGLKDQLEPFLLEFIRELGTNYNDLSEGEFIQTHILEVCKKVFSKIGNSKLIPELKSYLSQFLASLELSGKISKGIEAASYIKAMKLEGEQKTFQRENEKLNRNDPCPCGSGLKYKKCCMNLLNS